MNTPVKLLIGGLALLSAVAGSWGITQRGDRELSGYLDKSLSFRESEMLSKIVHGASMAELHVQPVYLTRLSDGASHSYLLVENMHGDYKSPAVAVHLLSEAGSPTASWTITLAHRHRAIFRRATIVWSPRWREHVLVISTLHPLVQSEHFVIQDDRLTLMGLLDPQHQQTTIYGFVRIESPPMPNHSRQATAAPLLRSTLGGNSRAPRALHRH